MEQKKVHSAATSAQRIMEMPLDPFHIEIPGLPIPLHKGVLVRKVSYKEQVRKSSIIIPNMPSENTADKKLGIICAVGPNCSEFIRIGLRVQINSFVDSYFFHEEYEFYKADEADIYYIIPDTNTYVNNGVKSAANVRRSKKLEEQTEYLKRMDKLDTNEKDKKLDKTKGKVKKLK